MKKLPLSRSLSTPSTILEGDTRVFTRAFNRRRSECLEPAGTTMAHHQASKQAHHDRSLRADLLSHEKPCSCTSNNHQLALAWLSQQPTAGPAAEYQPIRRSHTDNLLKGSSSHEERSTKNKHPPRRFPHKNSKPSDDPTMETTESSSKHLRYERSQSVNLFSRVELPTVDKLRFSLV